MLLTNICQRFFLKIGKTRVPIVALVAGTLIAAIFMLPFPSWYSLVGFISSATVFTTYVMGGIGLETLRRTASDLKRTFVIPGARIIAPIATIVAGLIVYWSAYSTLFYLVAALLLGLLLFFGYYGVKLGMPKSIAYTLGVADVIVILVASTLYYYTNFAPLPFAIYLAVLIALTTIDVLVLSHFTSPDVKKEIMAGIWVFALIFAIYILSYLGPAGPANLIPFPYDVLIAIIAIFIIHYVAVRSGFRTEAIEEIIEETKES